MVVLFSMRDVCRLSSIKTTGVHGTGSPVSRYAVSQFHISSLSDAKDSKNMHLALVGKLFNKEVQPVGEFMSKISFSTLLNSATYSCSRATLWNCT